MASGVFKKCQEKAVCCFPGEGGRVGKKRLLQYPPAYRSPLWPARVAELADARDSKSRIL